MSPKINYGIRELKPGEVRPSMVQAIDAKQVRYWGLYKIDARQIERVRNPPKKPRKPKGKNVTEDDDGKDDRTILLEQITEIKGKVKNLKSKLAASKDPKEKEEIENKLEKLKEEGNILIRKFNKSEKRNAAPVDKALTKASKHKFVNENPQPKKRGRPRKNKVVDEDPQPKKRGRPRKSK